MNPKKAVVTGANGFVGSHLVDLLLEKGFQVKCIVRKSSDLKWLAKKSIELDYCGLNDIDLLSASFKETNYIFHIAGTVKANNEAGFFYGNVELTKNVLVSAKSCRSTLQKIVITSSLAAAGPSEIGKPHTEKVRCKPVSDYGKSKQAQELLCQKYFDDLPIVIVRPPVVFGERDTEVLEFIKAVKSGIIPMAGRKEKYLSAIYVKDLVNGILLMALSDKKSNIYFLTGIVEMNWTQFGEAIAKVLNKKTIRLKIPHFIIKCMALSAEIVGFLAKNKPALNLNKFQEIKQSAWTCSAKKAKVDFGFEPNFTLEESLENTIAWYKENEWI